MALKALLLRKKIDAKRKELEALQRKDADFETRAAELEAAINEVTETTTQEERDAITEEVTAFDGEKTAHEEAKAQLEREIGELENDLEAEEAAQNTDTPAAHEGGEETRKERITMNTRDKIFGRMSAQEREAIFARDDVKTYLGEIRAAIKEKRAISNAGLLIPDVFIGLLRANVLEYSKLYKHVNVRAISGEGRMAVMGVVPEAVWTEMCANLNELDLVFNDVEVGCWKVGGYYAMCNAVLEDSDIDLAAELLTSLGQAMGLALDKAILYGTGTRMPLGVVARLAQTSEPAGYPATSRAWADLHTSNIKTLSAELEGLTLFRELALAAGAAKGKYSRGEKVWIMNETTYTKVIANAMSIDAGGAIVSGVNGTMPVMGGVIEVLDFVPDNVIIYGYFDLYLLAERAGMRFAQSEHVRFIADQTVFKGTARYDGLPVIAEGFAAIGIDGTTPGADMTFAPDTANEPAGIMLNTSTATVAVGGKVQLSAVLMPAGAKGTVTWSSGTVAKATVDSNGVVTGVASGTSVITATCNGYTASCTVTVSA